MKNYQTEFKLEIVKCFLAGEGGAKLLARQWSVPEKKICSGQVISDSLISFFDVDSRSKALGDKLPSFECSLMLL